MCKVTVAFAENPCLTMEDTLGKPTMLGSNNWAAAVKPLPQLRTVIVSHNRSLLECELQLHTEQGPHCKDLPCRGDKTPLAIIFGMLLYSCLFPLM